MGEICFIMVIEIFYNKLINKLKLIESKINETQQYEDKQQLLRRL